MGLRSLWRGVLNKDGEECYGIPRLDTSIEEEENVLSHSKIYAFRNKYKSEVPGTDIKRAILKWTCICDWVV